MYWIDLVLSTTSEALSVSQPLHHYLVWIRGLLMGSYEGCRKSQKFKNISDARCNKTSLSQTEKTGNITQITLLTKYKISIVKKFNRLSYKTQIHVSFHKLNTHLKYWHRR